MRVKLDILKKITRVVRFTKGGERESYGVKFEKLPTFFYSCGIIGHWHEECGIGDHDTLKFEWGPFILATRCGRGFGHENRSFATVKEIFILCHDPCSYAYNGKLVYETT